MPLDTEHNSIDNKENHNEISSRKMIFFCDTDAIINTPKECTEIQYLSMQYVIRIHCDITIKIEDLKYIHIHKQSNPSLGRIVYTTNKRGIKANIARLIKFLDIPVSNARKIFCPIIKDNEIPRGKRYENDFIKDLNFIFEH